jgi:hypothetical protein
MGRLELRRSPMPMPMDLSVKLIQPSTQPLLSAKCQLGRRVLILHHIFCIAAEADSLCPMHHFKAVILISLKYIVRISTCRWEKCLRQQDGLSDGGKEIDSLFSPILSTVCLNAGLNAVTTKTFVVSTAFGSTFSLRPPVTGLQ